MSANLPKTALRDFRDWLDGEMAKRSWGNSDLSKVTSLSVETIRLLRAGDAPNPTLETIGKICSAFNQRPRLTFEPSLIGRPKHRREL